MEPAVQVPSPSASPASRPPLARKDFLWSAAIFLVALFVFWKSPVVFDSDSRYTLLLSESLVNRGSFLLDGYGLPHNQPLAYSSTLLDGVDYQIEIVDGHFYYFFPPGSSVLSAPFVLAQDAAGKGVIKRGTWDVVRERGNQHFIASFLMAGLAAIFYLTARLLLPVGWSVVIALGAALGTQVYSTASRVLWNHTWGVALMGCVLWLLLARETGRRKLPPVLLATLLSWAYFVRPTNSLFIIGITIYVAWFHRGIFLRYAVTGAAWFAAFVAYSWDHYGAVLPAYFRSNRLEVKTLGEALAGNLIAPSRGLLIYVPVVLFVVALPLFYWRHRVFPRLLALAAGVSVCHYVAVSCFVPWYGGGCYGPRYTTELVPWLVLVAILGVAAARRRQEDPAATPHPAAWRAALTAGGVLLGLSVFIQARGANVVTTRSWNRYPETVDKKPSRVWDWSYPQILAGWISPPVPDVFPVLTTGQRVGFSSEEGRRYQLEGWNASEPRWCWSTESRATLIFAVDGPAPQTLRLRLAPYVHPPKLTRQRVRLRLNGQPVGEIVAGDTELREYRFDLPAGALRPKNRLTFELPDATTPASVDDGSDQRILGVSLQWLELDGPGAAPTPPAAGPTPAPVP